MTIDPYKYYIDRRKGIDVTETELYYTGAAWVARGCDVEFLREAIINENGVLIEVEQ